VQHTCSRGIRDSGRAPLTFKYVRRLDRAAKLPNKGAQTEAEAWGIVECQVDGDPLVPRKLRNSSLALWILERSLLLCSEGIRSVGLEEHLSDIQSVHALFQSITLDNAALEVAAT